ncbi:MAG TPA: threonine-phosphate decarboxylase CobD [Rhodocyclaceae bacterium]|nr:threonine-phosphate decarboxylase CobD [Rhodocyclaceae bacterium]
MLEHGGALNAAAVRYGRPAQEWLDLSTGINPHAYPVPALDPECWRRLPQDDDGLEAAARAYYGSQDLLAVAGSQAAIQALPGLLPPGRVLLLSPSYAEHAAAWKRAGHAMHFLDAHAGNGELEAAAAGCDYVLLCQPNNPTGTRFAKERLLALAESLEKRGGALLLDEAFIDGTPEDSLAEACGRPGLVVLRSLGKFFGLAGARVGFVLAEADLLSALREALGPWTLSGPARAVARAALADHAWQAAMRLRLKNEGERLARLLRERHLGQPRGTTLFQWLPHARAAAIHEALARRGILVRLYDQPPGLPSLRFGLPGGEEAWTRLAAALEQLENSNAI